MLGAISVGYILLGERSVDTERGAGESVLSCSLLIFNLPKQIVSNSYLYHKIQYELFTTACNLSITYIKAGRVTLIKICISIYLSWHVSYIIKRSIHHHLSFIHGIYYHHKQKLNQSINHMNTEVFTWKPSDWGENHGSFTIFKNLLCQSERWLGQQPLTITLPVSYCYGQQPLYTITSQLQPEGASTPTNLQCRP
jgi:hypothetical protein